MAPLRQPPARPIAEVPNRRLDRGAAPGTLRGVGADHAPALLRAGSRLGALSPGCGGVAAPAASADPRALVCAAMNGSAARRGCRGGCGFAALRRGAGALAGRRAYGRWQRFRRDACGRVAASHG
jgi:hypothetical protein